MIGAGGIGDGEDGKEVEEDAHVLMLLLDPYSSTTTTTSPRSN